MRIVRQAKEISKNRKEKEIILNSIDFLLFFSYYVRHIRYN